MKTWITLLLVLLASGAAAQTTNSSQALDAKAAPPLPQSLIESRPVEPSRMTGDRYSVGGIAAQAIKSKRVLQLLNPIAPPKYFAAAENLVREPKSGRVEGLRFLSLEF